MVVVFNVFDNFIIFFDFDICGFCLDVEDFLFVVFFVYIMVEYGWFGRWCINLKNYMIINFFNIKG